jgi:hypothetical protein
MDTPGFDTWNTREEVAVSVMQSVARMNPGPDAVLYVTKIGHYTEEDYGVYRLLKALLEKDVTKHLIVVFTHGDCLRGKPFRDIIL